jgi:hypothetical protein
MSATLIELFAPKISRSHGSLLKIISSKRSQGSLSKIISFKSRSYRKLCSITCFFVRRKDWFGQDSNLEFSESESNTIYIIPRTTVTLKKSNNQLSQSKQTCCLHWFASPCIILGKWHTTISIMLIFAWQIMFYLNNLQCKLLYLIYNCISK